jgi:hypothetical protein
MRSALGIVSDITWLQQAVHHTSLGDIKLEEAIFIESCSLHQTVISDLQGMDRVVLA